MQKKNFKENEKELKDAYDNKTYLITSIYK